MYLSEDGFVRPRIAPPDPTFALAMLWAYGVEKREKERDRLARAGLLEAPRQHDVLGRLTRAGNVVMDQIRSWTHGGTPQGRTPAAA